MVVGSGLLANAFEAYIDNQEVVIYASGVSDSKEIIKGNFEREEKLLRKIINENQDKILVYFSTCSIEDNSVNKSLYVIHKKKMETLIQESHNKFYIFRLSQVVGEATNKTLVNFLFDSILNSKHMTINKKSTRNLIHVDDIFKIVSYIIVNKIYSNEITNIATPYNYFLLDIVSYIEKITNIRASYDLIEVGEEQDIDVLKIKSLNKNFNIFKKNYTYNVLSRFFNEVVKNV